MNGGVPEHRPVHAVPEFTSKRERGLVWACDLKQSSSYLNDDRAVDALETFLPRLRWAARPIVEAAGGQFLKWTGDGFLAWFPFELDRHLGEWSSRAIRACWELSFLVNITQLGVSPKFGFRLRHGIAYEPDGLVMSSGAEVDVLGRSVVFAFRLAGVEAAFPGIVAERRVSDAATSAGLTAVDFRPRLFTPSEVLKYFKGERRGVDLVSVSVEAHPQRRSRAETLAHLGETIRKAEDPLASSDPFSLEFSSRILKVWSSGPPWAKQMMNEELRFIREELLGKLKTVRDALTHLHPRGDSGSLRAPD